MDKMAEKYSASVGQVALNWLVNFHGETEKVKAAARYWKELDPDSKDADRWQ